LRSRSCSRSFLLTRIGVAFATASPVSPPGPVLTAGGTWPTVEADRRTHRDRGTPRHALLTLALPCSCPAARHPAGRARRGPRCLNAALRPRLGRGSRCFRRGRQRAATGGL